MPKNIKIDDLENAVNEVLQIYGTETTAKIKSAIEESAKEFLAETRNKAPAKTGKYKRAMAVKTQEENANKLVKVWYVKAPHYRLAHLLEYGHAKVNGGRVKAYPHIRPAEKEMQENLMQKIEKAVKE